MDKIQELLNAIGQFRAYVGKSLSAKRDRKHWIDQAKTKAIEIRNLLADSATASEVDQLLAALHQELNSSAAASNASKVLSGRWAEFVRAESQLHELTHVRTRVYTEVVDEVVPWIQSPLLPDFPRNAREFSFEFEKRYEDFLRTVDTAPDLPRRQSKRLKGEFSWRFWRYSLGTLITLANIYITYHQPSFQGMGSTSVTVGAWYFVAGKGGPRKPPKGASNNSAKDEESDSAAN